MGGFIGTTGFSVDEINNLKSISNLSATQLDIFNKIKTGTNTSCKSDPNCIEIQGTLISNDILVKEPTPVVISPVTTSVQNSLSNFYKSTTPGYYD